ncbi:MAG: dTDP-4-dehydrorhamnose reductase [Fimbriiglobus sp.]
MDIAVLGSQGQLGRDLIPRLSGLVQPLTRAEIDLEKPETITAYFASHRPKLFVNCSAYNLVDKAESDPEIAFRVNAWGMKILAQACAANGVKLVHVSTDYVFGLDLSAITPRTEADRPGPVSQYGMSKLCGEYAVRTFAPEHLVIRTCGLYGVWGSGGKGGNFVETMLRVAGQGKPLRVIADQHCTPTSTADLAAGIVKLINANANGLFHLTNSGQTTWHEFASEIFRQSQITADLTAITTAEFNAPAKRPPYSVLDCTEAAKLGAPMRHWREALTDYLEERKKKG